MSRFLRTIQGLFNPKILIEETIQAQEILFGKLKNRNPEQEQHETLAILWLSRFMRRPTPENLIEAFSNTLVHACMPPSACSRALGYYILSKERRDLLLAYPLSFDEYNKLMEPIRKAIENRNLHELYLKYNPNSSSYTPKTPWGKQIHEFYGNIFKLSNEFWNDMYDSKELELATYLVEKTQ